MNSIFLCKKTKNCENFHLKNVKKFWGAMITAPGDTNPSCDAAALGYNYSN